MKENYAIMIHQNSNLGHKGNIINRITMISFCFLEKKVINGLYG